MKRGFRNIIVAALLILSIGGHWVILQSGAWLGMFISFSRTDSVAVAVVKTFDGKNPCSMCKLVAHAREAEKKQDHQLTKLKIDLFCLRNETLFFTTPPHEFEFASITLSRALSTSPPTPPPRSA